MENTRAIFSDKKIAWIVLISTFVYVLIILFISPGTYDYGDGLTHYFISHYSWKKHELFLDEWGKPLFTLLSSPFAQFGLKGISVFNVLCGIAGGYLAYKIASLLNIPFPYLAIIFTCLAPIYISVMNSGLTETLFSTMLICCIWLIMNKRYYTSAVVFSFLPFVRTEFLFVLPLFLLYYIIRRKYLAIFLMASGSVFFTIVGYFHYKDILWIFHQNPYAVANAANKVKGSIFAYIEPYQYITGAALAILIVLGVFWIVMGKYIYRKKNLESNLFVEEFLLIYGSFAAILAAHSIIWALGLQELGLLRYMANLIPLASIIALRGLQMITLGIPGKLAWLKVLIVAFFSIWLVYSPYYARLIPYKVMGEEEVVTRAMDWLKTTKYRGAKPYYLPPYIATCLDINPYDPLQGNMLTSLDSQHPEKDMTKNSILIWDAHGAPDETQMKIPELLNNKHLKLLNIFNSNTIYCDDAILIFALDTIGRDTNYRPYSYSCDAEKINTDKKWFIASDSSFIGNVIARDSSVAHSGKYSMKLTKDNPYGLTLIDSNAVTGEIFYASVWRYYKNEGKGSLVATCGKDFIVLNNKAKYKDGSGWEQICLCFIVPEDHANLRIYARNDGDDPVWFDDIIFIKYPPLHN